MPRITVQNDGSSDIVLYVPEVYYKTLVFTADSETSYDLTLREYVAFEVSLESVNKRADASVFVFDPVTDGAASVGQVANVSDLTLDFSAAPTTARLIGALHCNGDATFIAGYVRVGDGYVLGDVAVSGGASLVLNGLTIGGSVSVSGEDTQVELANCTIKGGLTVGDGCAVTQLFTNILGDVDVDANGTLTILPD